MKFKLSDINPRYLLDSRRYLLLSVGAGAIIACLIMLGIIPQVKAAFELLDKQSVETKKLDALSKKAQELENLSSSPVAQQIQTVEKVLPSTKPLLELMTSLNLAARESQINISALSLSPGSIATDSAGVSTSGTGKKKVKKSSSTTDTLDVDMTIIGKLEDVNRFFETVEKQAPLSTISSMALSEKDSTFAGSQDRMFEAKITITAYYFTQSVNSAVDTALPPVTSQQKVLLDELAGFVLPENAQQLEIQGGGLNDLFGVEQPVLDSGR